MPNEQVVNKSLKELSINLSKLPNVKQYGDEEAWGLADDFSDLDKSFRVLIEELFPCLMDDNLSVDDLQDAMTDIGDEFRHIVYHIGNNRFYRYLGISSPELSSEE